MAQDLMDNNKPFFVLPCEGALTPSLPPALQRVIASGLTALPIPQEQGGGCVLRERLDWNPPAIDEHLRDQAEAARDALLEHLESIEEGKLAIIVSRFLAHRWRGRVEEAGDLMQQGLLIDWIEDLCSYPEWAINSAFRTYRRTQAWHPTIADIRALCEEEVAEDRRSLRLLSKLLKGRVHGTDSNRRPSGHGPDELPGCSTVHPVPNIG